MLERLPPVGFVSRPGLLCDGHRRMVRSKPPQAHL